MSDQQLELLKQLAAKLGTTADHLWQVMLYQTRIELISTGVIWLIYAIAMWVGIRKIQAMMIAIREGDDGDDELRLIVSLAIGSVLLIFSIVGLFSIPDTINQIFNPEYWALKQILTAMGD